MHGAGGGALKGNRNAFKHGRYAAEAIEAQRLVAALIKRSREVIYDVVGPSSRADCAAK
jgi:hypothetical protein